MGDGCRRVVDPLEDGTRLRPPHLEDGRELERWVRERNCEWMERWEWVWLRFPRMGDPWMRGPCESDVDAGRVRVADFFSWPSASECGSV